MPQIRRRRKVYAQYIRIGQVGWLLSGRNQPLRLLLPQNIQGRLDLAPGVRVRGVVQAAPVELAGLVRPAQLLQSLPAMIIGGGVVCVGLEQRFEFKDRGFQPAGLQVFHRQSVAREAVAGIFRQQLAQHIDARVFWARVFWARVFQTVRIQRMACPFFMPEAPLESEGYTRAPRMPLGEAYTGQCHACSGPPMHPAGDRLRELCNFGYARGRCDRFPAGDAADAVRFSITAAETGSVRMVYVIESQNLPVEHGVVEYLIREQRVTGAPTALLASQARAFAASYFRSRG